MNDMHAPYGNSTTRRQFLQAMGSAGVSLGLSGVSHALVPEALWRSAAEHGRTLTFLEDGGFTGSAWGWQFTSGAKLDRTGGHGSLGAVHIQTTSGDYARFLVLGPVAGATYTLSGWMRTEGVVSAEQGAGAYFAASQFEFQGRPTEFTVDGKQATEIRYGNVHETVGWQRFSQSVKCLDTTSWFEVVVGLYRAHGQAWFSGLTFVQRDTAAELAETMIPREAAAFAHRDLLRATGRTRPRAAVLDEPSLPIRGATSEPSRLAELLRSTYDVERLSADEIADRTRLDRQHFDLLVLPCGETFPLPARETVLDFLAAGGDLLTMGGYAFQSPVLRHDGQWRFIDELLRDAPRGANLLPPLDPAAGWKASSELNCSLNYANAVARVEIAAPLRNSTAEWTFDLAARGERRQFQFEARWRSVDVRPASTGSAFIGVEQIDAQGAPAYAARTEFANLRGTADWQTVRHTFYLVPDCLKLRIHIGLRDATGSVEVTDVRLEARPDQVRLNTALGWPEDSLRVTDRQLGLFDADYRLRRVASLRTVPASGVHPVESVLDAEGYAASGVVGSNAARWVPLLEGVDASGRKRGAAGAMMFHSNGEYARSAWAFFGVGNHDLLHPDCAAGLAAFGMAVRALSRKCYLHSLETSYATYRAGEPVKLRVLLSNYGLQEARLRVEIRILEGDAAVFTRRHDLRTQPGETVVLEEIWTDGVLTAPQYRVVVDLSEATEIIDRLESAFNVWLAETLDAGMHFRFQDNYFQIDGRSCFLQGTDDYLHTFIDQDENPGTWLEDVQGCRDSAIDVYENLMGLRGPQHRPTEAWWRWVDAMLLNTQRVGGIFFPGMLVFSNTAVGAADLADQTAYVRVFARRYGQAAGIMYYLNGDLELHDPNLPDLQKLYNDFLLERYGDDATLRRAWTISPPEASLGSLTIHSGTKRWADVRTQDDFLFRTELVRRWLNAMHDAIREVDTIHPVTAEFYQEPVSGIDLLTALGKLELANFGYFAEKDEDRYRFPQVCRFLDQSMRGKGINVGEFGVKTHPAWKDTGYYIEARTEVYEQRYFLSLSHYGFGLGASKIQNWCWKYPADLPFEWGINYPNELVPRDVRAFYRNSGLLFRSLRPRYESSDTVVLLASASRMGGEGRRIVEGQLNAIRLLLNSNVRFATLTDEFLSELPPGVKTIFYPLPYCPSDEIVERLHSFAEAGGQLYCSGDITFDSFRQRTRTDRLPRLCGVEFVSARYEELNYGATAVATSPQGAWPQYQAAPALVVRPHGAEVLLAGVDGHPIVTDFRIGKGRVVFSFDPLELHGDARDQPYAQPFYSALVATLSVPGEVVSSRHGHVHCLRVPSQDGRRVRVLVNYGEEPDIVEVPSEAGSVQIALDAHLPGVIVEGAQHGVEAVESSGDVVVNGATLLASDLHVMLIALGRQPLHLADRLLVLPMGAGTLTLHTKHAFRKPVLLMGEIAAGRWRQLAKQPLVLEGGRITLSVTGELALSMLLVCDDDACTSTVSEVERWTLTPWKIEDAL